MSKGRGNQLTGTNRRRSTLEKLEHRAKIAELHSQGQGLREIASTLNISLNTVWRDLQVVYQEWRELAVGNLDVLKGRELARLDRVQAEAWQGWQRSLQETSTSYTHLQETGVKGERGSDGLVKEEPGPREFKRHTSLKKLTGAGNDKFLSIILESIRERNKILGTYAPSSLTAQTLTETIEFELRALAKDRGIIPPDDEPVN